MNAVGWPRALPPVHSPITARALLGAFTTCITGRDERSALAVRLAREYHADQVLLADSGTDALRIALTEVATPNAPVALPAYACYDVATAAAAVAGPIMVYDIDPRTLAPDLDSLLRALALGCRTVVVAPLFGVPIPMDEILRAAEQMGAQVIEDAAQGHGARWEGARLGSLAPLSVLSFGRGKGWTGGSGGALLFRGVSGSAQSDGRYGPVTEGIGALKVAGQWLLARPSLYGVARALPFLHLGETRYRTPRAPRAMRRAAATLLEETWSAAELEGRTRTANGEWFGHALPEGPAIQQVAPPRGAAPGWLRFPLLLPEGMHGLHDPRRARRLGIAPGYPRPLPDLPALRERLTPWCRAVPWPGARELAERLVTLPTHGGIGHGDRVRIVRTVER